MAGRIAGITIDIDGNTSKLESSLKSLDGSLRTTQNTLKDVNKLLKLDPGNTELLTQKQKNLESAIRGTNLRLNELKTAQEGVAEGTAEWDALQREIIATEQDLQGLEQEYRNFGSVGAQQVAAVGAKMQEVGGKIEGIGQKLAPVSAAAAGVVASLVGLGYSAVTSADDLNTLSKQTGLSTAEIQKMQYAADLVDVSFEDISGALKKMKGKMDPANETFQKLGVSVTDANGELRDSSTVFYETIEALSGIENETERDQVAMDLFGKSADQLAGIIDDGGAALKQFGQDAEDMGLILDQETLDSLNAINDTVDKTKARFRGAFAKAGATLAQKFAPALDKAAAFAETLADKIANLSPETLGLITKIAGVVAAIAPVLVVGGKLTSGIGKVLAMAPMIKTAITVITAALSGPLGVIALVVAAIAGLALIWHKWGDQIKAFTLGVVDGIKNAWEGLKAGVAAAVENVKAAVVEKWNGLKESVSTVVTNIKTDVYLKWVALKSLVSSAIDKIESAVVDKWESIKDSVSSAVNALKSTVVQTWSKIKLGVKTVVSSIVSTISSKFSSAWSTVVRIFNNIKSSIEEKINAARDTVSGVVETIKGFFDFDLKIPDIKFPTWEDIKGTVESLWNNIKGFFNDAIQLKFKLPKITMGTKDFQTFAGTISIPWPEIKWERKGYMNPVMFTKPTVMATPNGYYGFGDGHGAEIVLGLNKLRELVGSSGNQVTINVYPPAGANVEQIAAAVEQKLVAAQQRRIRVYA